MPTQSDLGAKEVVGFFMQWLKANNMGDTEAALMRELQNTITEAPTQVATQAAATPDVVLVDSSGATSPAPKPPRGQAQEAWTEKGKENGKRILPPPYENPSGQADEVEERVEKSVEKSQEVTESQEEEEQAGAENEEVDVVNFEASLAEQLKQLVHDLAKPNPANSVVESTEEDEDEWTDQDDLGYVRVPGRPSDEYYEICDDDEHRRAVAQYIEEMDAQHQLYLQHMAQQKNSEQEGSKTPSTSGSETSPGDTVAEKASDADQAPATSGENLATGERGSPTSPGSPKGPESQPTDKEAPEKKTLVTHKYGQAAAAEQVEKQAAGIQQILQNGPPIMYPNTYQTTGKEPPIPVHARKQPIYEAFDLKVIYQVHRTGFEEQKDYPIRMYDIIAGRYQILEYLGSAAFSRAVQCVDLKTGQLVCVKIIRNNKDFFDQGLDEIKLLHYLNANGDPDEQCVLQLYDYFYHKEHLFLVCELLRDNLYEFSKYNRESGDELYFNLPRLQKITRQVLVALRFIHNLNLIHCDLKPENILIKSYSRCEVKVIDFGSSCFVTDHLSSYVQSRCYRAPEVILGLPYNQKIDMWSLGAILTELFSGRVLFHNDSISTMMARIVAICGPFPDYMLQRARYSNRFFTRQGVLFERNKQSGQISYLYPKRTKLKHRVGTDDALFLDFATQLLHLDPHKRPTADEALQHPFLFHNYGPINPN